MNLESESYVSDRTEDLVSRRGETSTVTQGSGYRSPGDVRCLLTNTGNGYIAQFPANTCTRQDYFVCLDYSQARDLVLALSMFKTELGFE